MIWILLHPLVHRCGQLHHHSQSSSTKTEPQKAQHVLIQATHNAPGELNLRHRQIVSLKKRKKRKRSALHLLLIILIHLVFHSQPLSYRLPLSLTLCFML